LSLKRISSQKGILRKALFSHPMYLPGNKPFVCGNYYLSQHYELFHLSSAHLFSITSAGVHSVNYGINKKSFKVLVHADAIEFNSDLVGKENLF